MDVLRVIFHFRGYWPLSSIKSITALILPTFHPLTQALATIEPPVDLANLLGILRLVHPPLIRELHHTTVPQILGLAIQLRLGVKVPHVMSDCVFFTFMHDTGDEGM